MTQKKVFILALTVVFGIFLFSAGFVQAQRTKSSENSRGQGYGGPQHHQNGLICDYQINQDNDQYYSFQNCYGYLNGLGNQWQYNGRFSQDNNLVGPPWFTNPGTFIGGPSWYSNDPVEGVGPWWWQAFNNFDVSDIAPDWYINPTTATCFPSWYQNQTNGPWWWTSMLSTTVFTDEEE